MSRQQPASVSGGDGKTTEGFLAAAGNRTGTTESDSARQTLHLSPSSVPWGPQSCGFWGSPQERRGQRSGGGRRRVPALTPVSPQGRPCASPALAGPLPLSTHHSAAPPLDSPWLHSVRGLPVPRDG